MSFTFSGGGDADFEAMARMVEGDDLALNEIMERWTPRLGAFLVRFLGSEGDAVDLVQETFIAVYRAKGRYQPKAKFSTWIFGIASNLARQRQRWRRRHPEVALDLELEGELGSDPRFRSFETPSTDLQASERATAVKLAVSALPPDLRGALILNEYEELPHAEIARILHFSTKAVETRIYRARQLLRKSLRENLI